MASVTKVGINGVFVLAKNTTKANIEQWKGEMKSLYETPDQYGNSNTIKYEESTDDDGSRYINFSVS